MMTPPPGPLTIRPWIARSERRGQAAQVGTNSQVKHDTVVSDTDLVKVSTNSTAANRAASTTNTANTAEVVKPTESNSPVNEYQARSGYLEHERSRFADIITVKTDTGKCDFELQNSPQNASKNTSEEISLVSPVSTIYPKESFPCLAGNFNQSIPRVNSPGAASSIYSRRTNLAAWEQSSPASPYEGQVITAQKTCTNDTLATSLSDETQYYEFNERQHYLDETLAQLENGPNESPIKRRPDSPWPEWPGLSTRPALASANASAGMPASPITHCSPATPVTATSLPFRPQATEITPGGKDKVLTGKASTLFGGLKNRLRNKLSKASLKRDIPSPSPISASDEMPPQLPSNTMIILKEIIASPDYPAAFKSPAISLHAIITNAVNAQDGQAVKALEAMAEHLINALQCFQVVEQKKNEARSAANDAEAAFKQALEAAAEVTKMIHREPFNLTSFLRKHTHRRKTGQA